MKANTKVDQNIVTAFEHDEIIYFAVGNSKFDKVGRYGDYDTLKDKDRKKWSTPYNQLP